MELQCKPPGPWRTQELSSVSRPREELKTALRTKKLAIYAQYQSQLSPLDGSNNMILSKRTITNSQN